MGESSRKDKAQKLQGEVFDVVIIGGGINGAVAAAALSASNLRVALLERGDFASSTSQESSNLVWGGIKYLETYEFGLVWDLCRSRNELMHHYPDAVQELRFFTSLARGFRKPRILVFLGTVLYWMMGRFQTKRPSLLSKARINRDEPLIVTEDSQGGLEYSDCILKDNDARFVFHFIRRALRSGAIALNYGEALAATYQSKGLWQIKAEDRVSQQAISIQAKVLINAGGPYADQINVQSGVKSKHRHIFSKGVHLIVPRIGSSSRVLTFFADDGRLFFVIPMGSCSCIGTTDTRVKDLPAKVTNEDRHFILANINKRLRLAKPLTMDDVIAERCGVRPLVVEVQAENFDQEEWINLSRKHVLEIDQEQAHISIFGGKLTDCLNIGRELLEACVRLKLPAKLDKLWFGEGQAAIKTEFLRDAEGKPWNQKVWPGEARQSERLWRIYGDEAVLIAEHMHKDPSLQEPVQPEAPVLMAEVLYMAEYEMIVNLEDFLRRRTRLSLLVRAKDLEKSPGLRKACHILFAENAEKQWQTYFAKT